MAGRETACLRRLKVTFEENGPHSLEFYKAVENLIYFVQVRYMGHVDEELSSECYFALMTSIDHHFVSGKANIGNFAFSVFRNKVSTYLYYKKKRNLVDSVDDVVVVSRERHDFRFDHQQVRMKFSREFLRCEIEGPMELWDEFFLSLGKNHPLVARANWLLSRSEAHVQAEGAN